MIRFRLNGKETVYEGPEDRPLLRYLREEAGLTSVKDGCSGQAACGACLVELSGRPALSCSTPMKKVQGREVTTIEGFPEEVRRTLGRAFVAQGAVQCGFCTPGMITRAKILLQENPDPSWEEAAQALKANLCRCTGYVKIVEAILEAAAALREHRAIPWESGPGIGKSFPKYQAYERALGRSPFVDDLSFPGMLHGVLRFSDHPRARVLALDTSEAEKMEGVVRVFTAADIPGQRHQGLIVPDWPMMVEIGETTRYLGDVLAGVAARDRETARRAAQAVKVEYEVLKPLTDLTLGRKQPRQDPRQGQPAQGDHHQAGRPGGEGPGPVGPRGQGRFRNPLCGARLFGDRGGRGPAYRRPPAAGLLPEPGHLQGPGADRLGPGVA